MNRSLYPMNFWRIVNGQGGRRMLLALLLMAGTARGDWQIVQRNAYAGKVSAGVLELSKEGENVRLFLGYFAAGAARFRVITNASQELGSVEAAVDRENAVAGVNGGYFQADRTAVGLLCSDGSTFHSLQHAKLLSGVFYVRHGMPFLVRTERYRPLTGVTDAIQCGPFLVDKASVVPGLDPKRVAPRTFVFRTSQNTWGIGVLRSLSLADSAVLLAQKGLVPNDQIVTALNLDGGGSSGFYAKISGETVISPEAAVVGDYLLITAAKH